MAKGASTGWDCLPQELKLALLDRADHPTVIAMGGVSGAWRSAAKSHSQFYRTVMCFYNDRIPKPFENLVETLEATRCFSSLGVSLVLSFHEFILDIAHLKKNLLSFLPTLSAAFCDIIVQLRVDGHRSVFDEVLASLTMPAPRLHRLWLQRRDTSPIREVTGVIYPSIFCGNASLLRVVELENVMVSPDVPAFKSVTHVSLNSHKFDECLVVARVFPSVRDFTVTVAKVYGPRNQYPATLDLHDTTLHSLFIRQEPDSQFKLPFIPPTIERLALHVFGDVDISAHWINIPSPILVSILLDYVEMERNFYLMARSQYFENRCVTYSMRSDASLERYMRSLRMRVVDITHLMVTQGAMRATFLHWDGVTLPNLQTLVVLTDLILRALWPPLAHTHFSLSNISSPHPAAEPLNATLRCPALRHLHIRSPMPTDAGAVSPKHVLALGRALGLSTPAVCELKLEDVTWTEMPVADELASLFSVVTIIKSETTDSEYEDLD